MYANGDGVAQDYAEAAKWYRRAAEQGHATAQFNLGNKYCKGQGVAQDYAQALKWYRRAVEQGHADAQYNLGVMYRKGQGVAQNAAANQTPDCVRMVVCCGRDPCRSRRAMARRSREPRSQCHLGKFG